MMPLRWNLCSTHLKLENGPLAVILIWELFYHAVQYGTCFTPRFGVHYLLSLAREAYHQLSMEDIENHRGFISSSWVLRVIDKGQQPLKKSPEPETPWPPWLDVSSQLSEGPRSSMSSRATASWGLWCENM